MSQYYHNLFQKFEAICLKQPENIAVQFEGQSYQFKKLFDDVNKISLILRSYNLVKGDVVLLFNDKSYYFYVLMLACLKNGFIYSNISPKINNSWLGHVLNICTPKLIIGASLDKEIEELTNDFEGCIYSDLPSFLIQKENKASVFDDVDIDGCQVAYIMFTSGSTGKPKGVAITHQNLLHFIFWGQKRFRVTSDDIFSNVNPMYFDNSVFDFYISIFNGAALAPISEQTVLNPLQLVQAIDNLKCTIWFSVPSLLIYLLRMKVLTKSCFKSLKCFVFGGEGFPKTELKKLYDLYHSRATIVNVYGPTECTCICSSYDIEESDFEDMSTIAPLGILNDNISAIIVDDMNQENLKGELCLLGPNVACGYYNDIEKTQQNFVSYSKQGYYQATMYKTGDLVEKKGAYYYFLGRKDNQIKRMGYRIELESIEYVLSTIDSVFEAAAISVKHPLSNTVHILAYVASENDALTEDSLDKKVRQKLPTYMVPNKYYICAHLPKNSNGKIDKKVLASNHEQSVTIRS